MFAPCKITNKISLLTNHYQTKFKEDVYKYTLNLEAGMSVPSDRLNEIVREYIFKHKDNLNLLGEAYGKNFILLNGILYSSVHIATPTKLAIEIKREAVKLPDENLQAAEENQEQLLPSPKSALSIQNEFDIKGISFENSGSVDLERDSDIFQGILGRLFKELQRKLRFKRIGVKMFDSARSKTIGAFELWPGFSTALVSKLTSAYLNIDIVTKIITKTRVLEAMTQIFNRNPRNFKEMLNNALIGKSVMTYYNLTFYTIRGIDFDLKIHSPIPNNEKSNDSFAQYYLKRYKIKIEDSNQPLLIAYDKKSKKEIHLIPELCMMTGLTEENRADFNLMKTLDAETKPNAAERLRRSTALIKTMKQNPMTNAMLSQWNIEINEDPLPLNGGVISPGNLLFREGKEQVDIERCQNLDRDTQKPFYDSKRYNLIIIFYPRQCNQEFQTFRDMTREVSNQMNIDILNFQGVEIHDTREFTQFKIAIDGNLNPGVTACIFILPGAKKKGLFYEKIKFTLTNSYPVPSQVILQKTIQAQKNFRSIVTKIYVQLCAKVGGIPWAINNLPFTNKPTMVIGLNHYKKSGEKFGIYAMVATMDSTFATYWSASSRGGQDFSFADFVAQNLTKAMERFVTYIPFIPETIIVLQNGVSRGEYSKIKNNEVEKIKHAYEEFPAHLEKNKPNLFSNLRNKPNLRLLYILSAATTNVKFFYNQGNNYQQPDLKTPPPGTYVHEQVSENEREFFLICHKAKVGLSCPTSYYLIENQFTDLDKTNVEEIREAAATLITKLSYLYYNTTGSIKVPAPIHYAVKLSEFVGDKSIGEDRITPHSHLGDIKSLHFI